MERGALLLIPVFLISTILLSQNSYAACVGTVDPSWCFNLDPTTCGMKPGCAWNSYTYSCVPVSCSSFDNPANCQDVPGCSWQPVCGDGICEEGESACQVDCGAPGGGAVGDLSAGAGGADPGSHDWGYDPNDPDIWNEMLQLKLTASNVESVNVQSFTFQAAGTGNDSKDVARLEIYLDANKDGNVNAGELRVGVAEPAYQADNGQTAIGTNFNILPGETKNVLIAYVMAANPPVNKTYSFTITAIKAVGVASNKAIAVANLPIKSGTKTTIVLPCEGTLNLKLKPSSTRPSKLVTAETSGLKHCANAKIEILKQSCILPRQVGQGIQKIAECSTVSKTGTGGSCDFTAPAEARNYTYYACVDKNADNDFADAGEEGKATLSVSACKGPHLLSFDPNPAQTNQQVAGTVSGLQNCAGIPLTIVDSKNVIIHSANSTETGTTFTFNAAKTSGAYTYSALIDMNGNGKNDADEIATSSLNVLKPGESGSAGQTGTSPPENLVGETSPTAPECQDCTPSAWETCEAPAGSLEGTQKGICTNNCGYILVKTQACSLAKPPAAQKPGAGQSIAQQLAQPGSGAQIAAIAVLVVIVAGAFYYFGKKKA